MKLINALETWFKRAKIEIDLSGIPDIDLPENSESAVDGLMNIQMAKNNKELRNNFFQLFAKKSESKLKEIAASYELDLSIDEIDGVENKIDHVFQNISEKLKSGSKTSDNEQKMSAKILDLNKQLSESKLAFEAQIKSIHSEYNQKAVDSLIENQLSKINYKEGLNKSDMVFLAKNKLNDKLKSLGAQVTFNGETIDLIKNDESLVVDDNGLIVKFDDLVKQATIDLVQTEKVLQPIVNNNINKNNIKVGVIENQVGVSNEVISKASKRF